MRLIRFILIVISLFSITNGNAGEVIIFGTATEYANTEVIFKTYSDYITHTEIELGKCKLSGKGEFTINIKTEQDIVVFAEIGIYKAFLYTEKGKQYEIILPPKKDKTFEDLINPYFREFEILLQTKDTSANNLTTNIKKLQLDINEFISRHEREIIVQRLRKIVINNFITELDGKYPANNNSYFNNNKKYEFGNLEYLIQYTKPKKLIDKYFANQAILYHNEAYMNLFNQVFNKLFDVFLFSKHESGLSNIINEQRSLLALKNFVSVEMPELSDSLTELVIIKGLYDAYYSNNYSSEDVDIFLDSLLNSTNIEEHKLIISNIKAKRNWLTEESDAPEFNLFNIDSVAYNIKDFRGKYLYLNFCTYKTLPCKDEFEVMKVLYKKFSKKVEFVSVSIDPSFEDFEKFMKKNNYKWIMLSYRNQKDILNDYRVKKYPSFYLIDPYGKIILAPALMPSENFENQFYGILNKRT